MEPMQMDEMYLGIEDELDLYGSSVLPTEEIMPGISPIWYKELATLDIPVPSWVVDKLIPDESITIVSAPPDQYKTWLVFDIAIHVAHGEPLFSQLETKKTKVLIVDEESGLGRLRHRLQMLGVTKETQICVTPSGGFKLSEESAELLINFCMAHNIGLAVFDSLTRIHDGEENSAKDMSIIMGNLKKLAQTGIAVIVIHHDRKPGQFGGGGANEMRGSGDILAACDVQISVKRKETGSNIITIKQNKNRDAPHLEPFDLKVSSDENRLWFEYLGTAPKQPDKNAITDAAILASLSVGKPRFQAQIIEDLKGVEGVGGEKIVSKRLKLLLYAGELIRTVGENGKHVYTLSPEQTNE